MEREEAVQWLQERATDLFAKASRAKSDDKKLVLMDEATKLGEIAELLNENEVEDDR